MIQDRRDSGKVLTVNRDDELAEWETEAGVNRYLVYKSPARYGFGDGAWSAGPPFGVAQGWWACRTPAGRARGADGGTFATVSGRRGLRGVNTPPTPHYYCSTY